jgi:hypothetical protein
MRDAHEINAWLLIGLNAAAGAWCLAAYRWTRLRGRPMWIVVIAAQLTTFTAAILGVALSRTEDIEIDDMHMLYGFSAIVAVGILYSYRTSPFMQGKDSLLYGFGSLFIMGLGLRNLVL